MNITGAIFAITGIVLYAIDLANASLLWMCDQSGSSVAHNGDNCRNVALFAQASICQVIKLTQSCSIWHDLVSLHELNL